MAEHTKCYLRPYTVDWNNWESDTLHLEYSYDKEDWYALNGNNGVLMPVQGSKRIKNPSFVKNKDGYYSMYGDDVCNDAMVYKFDTDDFISYKHEVMLFKERCGDRGKANEPIEITMSQLDALKAKWGKPEPVVMEGFDDIKVEAKVGEKVDMPATATVNYNNGGNRKLKALWPDIDTSKAGTYTIEGKAIERHFTNPLIYHRADPFIYKHTDGNYYFTASYTDMEHNLDGKYQYIHVIIRKAASIEKLADGTGEYEERTIFSRNPLPGDQSPHIWAPEIHFIDGKWYVYFTTSINEMDLWSIRPHVLQCQGADPMKDEWKNLGPLKKTVEEPYAFTDFSLDHTVLQHKGELFLFWAEKHPEYSKIYAAKMVNPWTIDSNRIAIVVEPTYNWEIHGFPVCEGPGFVKRNGKIFMTYSASGTDSLYCVGLIYADENADLLDCNSWTKVPYPVFQNSVKNGQFGPGHNSFTTDEDGNDVIVYHARQEEKYLVDETYQPLYNAGRNASVSPVYWDKDGMPDFSVPIPDGKGGDEFHKITATVVVK